MAENAIQIIIDVLAKEGITSVNDFSKAAAGAMDVAGKLSVSVDDLDGSLLALSKSGLNARDMAAGMVTAFEDAGVVFKDDEGAVKILAGALVKLGVAGKEAASGIDLANKANEEFIGPSNTATDSIIRQGGAYKVAATDAGIYASAVKGLQVGMASSAIMQDAAIANLGTGYAKMTSLAEMATPALMKAATWAGIGLAGLAYEGIKQYTQFNKLITQTITQAGVAPSKMGFLTNLAESVAKSTGQGLSDVANTIYRAASGTAAWNDGLGATKSQLTGIVTQVSKLNILGNIASGAESEQASRVITALINSNIRGIGTSPTKAAALINAQVGSGDIRAADLVPAYGRGLLASAKANNMTAIDTASWVDTLTSTGMTGGIAGNYVKTGINLLAHPSSQGTQALAMLGIKPGEMENLISSPGGLVSALSTLKTGMKQLNPGNAGFFFDKLGIVRPGGSGRQGTLNKLQSWSANELNPKFVQDWLAGKLTAKEQTQATDLILTKAFGGSKQFATVAAVVNNLNLVKGIRSHLIKEDTSGYLHAAEARAEATPAQQFARMKQSVIVDLVNMGKELTPVGLEFGHIMTGVIGGLTKFKGVIIAFVTMALGLLGVAGISKFATLASHLSPLIGAGYNRLGNMAGRDSRFTTAMNTRANSGSFKFLDIYGTHKSKILSKLGGDSINAGLMPGTEALSTGENVLNSTMAKNVLASEKTALNTQIIADAMAGNGFSGGGSFVKAGGRGGAAQAAQAAANDASMATRNVVSRGASMATSTPGGSFYFGNGIRKGVGGIAEGSIFRDAKSGRWTKQLANGRRTFISNAEAYASGAMNGPKAIGVGSLENGTRLTASAGGDVIALGEKSVVPAAEKLAVTGAEKVAVTGAASVASAGLGDMIGGFLGGPIGMMAMMMAGPTLIGGLTPLIGKLGSLFGHLFGNSSGPVYNPHINNPLDVTSAAVRLAKAAKNLRAYQKQVKNKAGKETWVNSTAAILADGPGYLAAHKAYIKAGGQSHIANRDASQVDMTAESYLYGHKKDLWSRLIKIDHSRANQLPISGVNGPHLQEVALHRYISMLPGGPQGSLQKGIWKKIDKSGTTFASDYKDIIAPSLRNQNNYYKKVFADASSQSIQSLEKGKGSAPAFAAMLSNGLFSNNTSLQANYKEISSILNNKSIGVRGAAELLPLHAQRYHQIMVADQKALAATGADKLTGDVRTAFIAQEKQAKDQLTKTNEMIRTMRESAKHTQIDGESVQKLAQQIASDTASSALPSKIAAELAKVLNPYLKTPKTYGTSGPVGRGGAQPGVILPTQAQGN